MKNMNFTVARVDGYKCEPGKSQSIFWDAKQSGLGLRVTATGSKAYIFESRLHGKTVRITIGSPDTWPLESYMVHDENVGANVERRGARQEASRLKALTDQGIDPREHRAEQRAAYDAEQVAKLRKSTTVAEAWADYLDYLRTRLSPKTKKPRSENYLRDHAVLAASGGETAKRGGKTTTRGPLWPLMALKLPDLTANKMAAWLEAERPERPTSAAYAYRMLKAFVRWAEGQDKYSGIIPPDCVTSPKVTGALPSRNTKDGDSLQREQLVGWFGAVRALSNPVASTYLQGLLITGARREELAALRWDDVDFQWRSLHLADKVETLTGRTIPLSPYLAFLLLELKRINDTPPNVRRLARMESEGKRWEPSEWVFASKTAADGRIAEPRFAHNQALAAASLPHVTIHGLRRSFSTLSEWVECPTGVVAQIQGHRPSATAERHYKRRPLDLLRMWHDRIESWMLEQAGIDFKPDQTKADAKVATADLT